MTRGAALLLAVAAGACGMHAPGPAPRVVSASPLGPGAATAATPEILFSAPASPDGLVDGVRVALVPATAESAALAAVESDAGAAGLAPAVAVAASLGGDGSTLTLAPLSPLRAFTAYSLVLSSRARAADGRVILDPEGRRRPFVARFGTGAQEGPQPLPVLTEARARAATPEAGGEYVEVANLGAGSLDLEGWWLSKRTLSGAVTSCAISLGAPLQPGGVAVVAGGAWDGRYALPAGTPVARCGATALLGGLADDRAPDLWLSTPLREPASMLGSAGGPVCAAAVERVDLLGRDEPGNLACSGGSPGVIVW